MGSFRSKIESKERDIPLEVYEAIKNKRNSFFPEGPDGQELFMMEFLSEQTREFLDKVFSFMFPRYDEKDRKDITNEEMIGFFVHLTKREKHIRVNISYAKCYKDITDSVENRIVGLRRDMKLVKVIRLFTEVTYERLIWLDMYPLGNTTVDPRTSTETRARFRARELHCDNISRFSNEIALYFENYRRLPLTDKIHTMIRDCFQFPDALLGIIFSYCSISIEEIAKKIGMSFPTYLEDKGSSVVKTERNRYSYLLHNYFRYGLVRPSLDPLGTFPLYCLPDWILIGKVKEKYNKIFDKDNPLFDFSQKWHDRSGLYKLLGYEPEVKLPTSYDV